MKNTVALLAAAVLVVGGGLGGVAALDYVLDRWIPELGNPGNMSRSAVMLMLVPLIVCFLIGVLAGVFLWLLAMRVWLTRQELENFISRGRIPSVLTRMLNWLYGT